MSNLLSNAKAGILIDIDEVRIVIGTTVLFKGDSKMYDIGQEAADAVVKAFSPPSDEQQPEPRDTSQG